jgi:hypothetical protein
MSVSSLWWRQSLLVLCFVLLAAGCAHGDVGAAKAKRVNLAFVLLAEARFPSGEDIVRAFDSFAFNGHRLHLQTDSGSAPPSTVLGFELPPGGTAFVAPMAVAVPGGEAEGGARFSVSALRTGWELPVHKAHMVVAFRDTSNSAIDSVSRFTSLLAALAKASDAVGVYWGSAGATHDAKFFIAAAEAQETVLRMMLWTGVSVATESEERLSLLSVGMKQLDLPDLLLVAPKSRMDEALEMFFDLLAYVAERGRRLPDGDTVGRSDTERLAVRYVASPIDPNAKVWRVEMK